MQGHTGEASDKALPLSPHLLLVLPQPPLAAFSLRLDQLLCVSQGPWQPLLNRDFRPFRASKALRPGLPKALSEAQCPVESTLQGPPLGLTELPVAGPGFSKGPTAHAGPHGSGGCNCSVSH